MAVEAVQRVPRHSRLGQIREDVGRRRGRNIRVVAAARELVGLVFYGLRDHHIRCLSTHRAAAQREQPRKPRWARIVFVSDPRSRRGRPFVSGPAHRNLSQHFMPPAAAILNLFVKRPLRPVRAGWLGRAGDLAAEPRGR